jgi:hypothetical protein
MVQRFYESPMLRRKLAEEARKEEEEDRKKEAEKLKELLREISNDLKNQGIPVDSNCRIDMSSFDGIDGIYKKEELDNDLKKAKEIKSDIEESLLKDGERLEALKTIVFYKFLSEKFIIVRASFYDDVFNQVDNLIIEKETGNIVCAFDEVSTISGPAFAKKQERFLRKNNINGARLKYGILSTKGGLTKGEIENIPIFYLALPPEIINEGIRNLSSLKEISDYERKLWTYFLTILKNQIAMLKLEKNLNETLKYRLLKFEEAIEEFEQRKEGLELKIS